VIAGSVRSDSASPDTGWDGYIVRTDDRGNEQWNRFFQGKADDFATGLAQTPDEGFIVTGTTRSFGAGREDIFLLKLNGKGDEEWFTTFGGAEQDTAGSLALAPGGGFVIFGTSCPAQGPASSCTPVIIRTDDKGKERWRWTGNPGTGTVFGKAPDGTSFLATPVSASTLALFSVGDTGTTLVSQSLSTLRDTTPGAVAPLPGGEFAITGQAAAAAAGAKKGLTILRARTGAVRTEGMAPAQTTEKNAFDLAISVREGESGNPIGGALVYLDGSARGETGKTDGKLILREISRGRHSVRIARAGFEENTKTVDMQGERSLSVAMNPSKVIPIGDNGPSEGRIDIVFVPSHTQYSCNDKKKVITNAFTGDRATFEAVATQMIANTYFNLDTLTAKNAGLQADYKSRFNFYYYWDPGNYADAFDGCAGKLPARFFENAPFTDVAIILYPTYQGYYTGPPCEPNGCANGMGPGTQSWFKIPADSKKLFLHESGHVVFGLIDTYCGETYYVENSPNPNVWGSESSCTGTETANHWTSSSCRQIAKAGSSGSSCSKPFWRWDPEPDIMGTGAYSGTFGTASTTRMKYIFDTIKR
jgi:hypothetical protein